MFMRRRVILIGLVFAAPFWLALILGLGHLRGAAQRGELPVMPWSAR